MPEKKHLGWGAENFCENMTPSYRKLLRTLSRLKNNVRFVLFSPENGRNNHFFDDRPCRKKFENSASPYQYIYKIVMV
jgi:hypothetical protein